MKTSDNLKKPQQELSRTTLQESVQGGSSKCHEKSRNCGCAASANGEKEFTGFQTSEHYSLRYSPVMLLNYIGDDWVSAEHSESDSDHAEQTDPVEALWGGKVMESIFPKGARKEEEETLSKAPQNNGENGHRKCKLRTMQARPSPRKATTLQSADFSDLFCKIGF